MPNQDAFFRDGADELAHWHGQPVTYKPAAASGLANRTVQWAVVGDETRDVRQTERGREIVFERQVTIVTDPTAAKFSGLQRADLQENATVEIDGTTYLLQGIASAGPQSEVLHLERNSSMAKTRPGYYRQRGRG